MAQWATELKEAYRRLQRALARARSGRGQASRQTENEEVQRWTNEEGDNWYYGRWRRDDRSEASERAPREPLPEPEWEKYDIKDIEVLPTEILGWASLEKVWFAQPRATRRAFGHQQCPRVGHRGEGTSRPGGGADGVRAPPWPPRFTIPTILGGELGLLVNDADSAHDETETPEVMWVGSRLPSEVLRC